MTGPEHYKKAEQLAEQSYGQSTELAAYSLQRAQVHATLALTAAFALNDNDGGMSVAVFNEWHDVATKQPKGGESS